MNLVNSIHNPFCNIKICAGPNPTLCYASIIYIFEIATFVSLCLMVSGTLTITILKLKTKPYEISQLNDG